MNVRSGVLEDAANLVNGDRQNDYGPPSVNFNRIAILWNMLFPDHKFTAAEVALAMAAVKIARGAEGYKYDTAVDLAGYAALWAELSETDD